jgi:hypothetical protein
MTKTLGLVVLSCGLAACSNGGAKPDGGAAGSTGGAGSSGALGAINAAASVLERGHDHARTAHWVVPTLTKANVMTKMALDADFKATFSGQLSGVPLFVASTTAGKGYFLVATRNSNVYALDEATGATVWMHALGAGGHGVIGTPVADATARAIYVAADVGGKHGVHALSLDTGDELPGWPVDVSVLKSGDYAFNSVDQNQRGALSIVGQTIFVPYGGYYGDGGNYRGWVVAIDTKTRAVAGWATAGQQEGIWAPGGMASDGNGVFAITGNNGSAPQTHLDSEEIIRVTAAGTATHDDANVFYPSIWRTGMDQGDKDFGSCSPLVVMATGGTPATLLVAPAKPGHLYLLDAKHLGGLGGQLRDLVVADTGAESVYTAPTAYKSPSGLRLAITTTVGAVCPDGKKDSQLMGLKLDTTTNPITPTIAWCATTSGDDDIRRRSPISTTTDGTANPIVWFMNGAKLNAFDGETGATLYASGDDCAGVQRHTSPIVAGGRVVVGANGHLCAWRVGP